MTIKTLKKGATPTVRRVVLYVPTDLAKRLKVYAAENDTNVSALVNALIEKELEKGGKKG